MFSCRFPVARPGSDGLGAALFIVLQSYPLAPTTHATEPPVGPPGCLCVCQGRSVRTPTGRSRLILPTKRGQSRARCAASECQALLSRRYAVATIGRQRTGRDRQPLRDGIDCQRRSDRRVFYRRQRVVLLRLHPDGRYLALSSGFARLSGAADNPIEPANSYAAPGPSIRVDRRRLRLLTRSNSTTTRHRAAIVKAEQDCGAKIREYD